MWIELLTALCVSQSPAGMPSTAPSTAQGAPVSVSFPAGTTDTINIVQWDGNALPKVYERSSQLPLTDEGLQKLSKAFDPAQLVKMIEERRCACDASPEGLIKLKEAGVPKQVIAAVSLHSLPPNRALNLLITLDFTGNGSKARDAFFYVFIDDGDWTRVLSANIGDLLARKNANEVQVDRSDLTLMREARRIMLPGQVALKRYGKHTAMVVASANPVLTHPSQLKAWERRRAQVYTFDYPASSVTNQCRLMAGYRRDPVLDFKWNFITSRFECEWE
ncbi:MAG: hypothetical protein ACKVPX_07690 [Myxococcaceae bacterium]